MSDQHRNWMDRMVQISNEVNDAEGDLHRFADGDVHSGHTMLETLREVSSAVNELIKEMDPAVTAAEQADNADVVNSTGQAGA